MSMRIGCDHDGERAWTAPNMRMRVRVSMGMLTGNSQPYHERGHDHDRERGHAHDREGTTHINQEREHCHGHVKDK